MDTSQQQSERRMVTVLARAVVAVAVLVFLVFYGTHEERRTTTPEDCQHEVQQLPVAIDSPEQGQTADEGSWAADMSRFDAGTPDIGSPLQERFVPAEPLKGQKKPPCEAPREQTINGGCWAPHFLRPTAVEPCSKNKLWRHGELCFMPVRAEPGAPTSLEESSP